MRQYSQKLTLGSSMADPAAELRRNHGAAIARLGLALLAVACALLPQILLHSVLQDRSTFILFTLAVMVSARFGGLTSGMAATALSIIIASVVLLGPAATARQRAADPPEIGLFGIVGIGITWLAGQLHAARIRAEGASAQVKTLEGLLPICAGCKKIRVENGHWEQIEAYVSRHSKAEFSHGFCDECFRRLYP